MPLLQLGMPLALGVGGLAAWRATRHRQDAEDTRPAWRDTSLDDWREERERRIEEERASRTKDSN